MMYRQRFGTFCTKVHFVHFLMFFADIAFLLQNFLNLVPMFYYMIWIGNVASVLQFELITQNVVSNQDQESINRRKNFYRLCYMNLLGQFLVGLIPYEGYGSLCSEKFVLPLGFAYLAMTQIFYTILIW